MSETVGVLENASNAEKERRLSLLYTTNELDHSDIAARVRRVAKVELLDRFVAFANNGICLLPLLLLFLGNGKTEYLVRTALRFIQTIEVCDRISTTSNVTDAHVEALRDTVHDMDSRYKRYVYQIARATRSAQLCHDAIETMV